MTDWIGETFTSDVGWDHLEALVDTDTRMAGSDGERRAAEATRDALEGVGARDARLEEFDLQGWSRGSAMQSCSVPPARITEDPRDQP